MTAGFVERAAGPPPTSTQRAADAFGVAIDAASWGWCRGRAFSVDDGVRRRCASQLLSDVAIDTPGLCSWLHVVVHAVLVERAASTVGLDPFELPDDLDEARDVVTAAAKAAGLGRPVFGLPSWNDAAGRTAAEVAELFNEARFRVRTG
jgi:hypothetical protein